MADPALLELLDAEKRTLITGDVNSVPRHSQQRIEGGLTPGGVIYVDSRRLRQADTRGLIRRLGEVVQRYGDEDWTCRSAWL